MAIENVKMTITADTKAVVSEVGKMRSGAFLLWTISLYKVKL